MHFKSVKPDLTALCATFALVPNDESYLVGAYISEQ